MSRYNDDRYSQGFLYVPLLSSRATRAYPPRSRDWLRIFPLSRRLTVANH